MLLVRVDAVRFLPLGPRYFPPGEFDFREGHVPTRIELVRLRVCETGIGIIDFGFCGAGVKFFCPLLRPPRKFNEFVWHGKIWFEFEYTGFRSALFGAVG